LSNIPPADFSAMIPGEPREETNPENAREPIGNTPLVTQIPQSDPAKSLADQIADILGEPPAERDPDVTIATPSQFPSQDPAQGEPATPPAAPAPSSPPPGEGEGGGDAVSGPSAAPPDSPGERDPATLTEAERVSLDALAEQLYGRPPSRDESLAIMQLWEDVARLTPEQKTQVARAMGYIPDDAPVSRPAPAPSTPTTPDPTEDETDPYLAPHLAPLQSDLSELRNQVQSLVSDRQQTEAQRMEQEVNMALETFRDTYAHLSPEEHAALQLRIRQNGIVAANYQQTGNIADSVTRALEYEMYRDENMRAKLLQVQQEQEQQQVRDQQQRQHKAASLGPGGAQVNRDETPPPPKVMNRHEARDAMRAELQPLFNQQ